MDLSVLSRLSTDGLIKMQEQIKVVLASRLDTTLNYGRIATFKGRDGLLRTITIDRINGKSVSGRETGASLKPGSQWRVSKNMISVVPEVKKAPVVLTTPHRPVSPGASW